MKGKQVKQVLTLGGVTGFEFDHVYMIHKGDHIRDFMERQLTPLSSLSPLPGVPHLHVNRPLEFRQISTVE